MLKDKLLEKIIVLDFMATDLALYLDTHPNDQKVIREYNEIIIKADQFRCEYENKYGPLCSYRSVSRKRWHWVDDPWPWQYDFSNCVLAGEEM